MKRVLLVLVLASGCGDGDDANAPAAPVGPTRVATFNAGLAVGFVDGAESRAGPVADAVGALDADVVCVQEVWLPEHVALLEGAATAFPHRLIPEPLPPEQTGGPACADGDLDDVLECIETSCGDACVDDLADCLFTSCALPFLTLPPACQGCAMAQVGEDPEEARAVCETQSAAYAYGDSFGTGILSRWPLLETEERVFASHINRRGALHAVVDAPGGPLDVYCTHLTPDFGVLPFPDEEGSWVEEVDAQIAELRAWVDEGAGDRVAVLGDFNTGPELEGIDGELPDSFAALSEGYEVPYVDQVAECTLCGDNPLRLTEDSRLIDHVLLRGIDGATAERILDGPITAESCGESIDAALSDHYGVLVEIAAP